MKKFAIIGLLAALTATAAPSLAQGVPPAPNPAMRQQFQAMHARMQQIRSTERSQILGALTPAHRALLATVAGELATSVTPDFKGAASRLDAALSAGEKQAIVNAAQSARDQRRSLMQSMRSQMPEHMNRPPMPNRMQYSKRTPDAGRILLGLTAGGEGMHGGMHMGRPRS
jgi:hypothetical protein